MPVDAGGNQVVSAIDAENTRATYSAAIFGHAPAATPTDFFTVLGSATKIVRLQRIWVTGRATAATWFRVRLLKYSAIYTGGTPVAVTPVIHDFTDPAATATINTWAGGLPTVGSTLLGALHDDNIPLQAATMTATQPFTGPPGVSWDFERTVGKSIKLKDNTEYFALNGVGAALPTGTVFDIKVEFTETAT